MEISAFCSQSRVLIVAGKGGVGKTTMVAALAHLAAQAGLSVLVVELEGRAGVATAFGSSEPLDYAGSVLRAAGAEVDDGEDNAAGPSRKGTVRARTITPDDALLEYLADHGMRRISKRLLSSGIIDIVAGAIPGIRDILVLGKVKQIERSGIADLVLVDAPATGHTMTFLSSAGGLLDAARGGPIRVPGRRRGGPALRSGTMPGGPGHAARGDAGQRGHRGRLPARGQGGRRPRAGDRQRLLSPARRPGDPGGRGRPGRLGPASSPTWSRRSRRPVGSG